MALYFISDLHLQEQNPAITQGFVSYARQLGDDTEALYILGDFFEFWVGDDNSSPLIDEVQQVLLELKERHIPVFFQHGNRDFLIGKEFAQRCGMQLLDEEHIIEYSGIRFLLMHGDSLCTDDQDYMTFRQQARDPAWQQQILAMSLEERIALATQLRETSQQETQSKAEHITDVSHATVIERMQAHQVQHLIHGHTHRPQKHKLQVNNKAGTRNVLGDWSNTHGWQIIVTNNGLELSLFNFAML